MKSLYNNKILQDRRRDLRKNQTKAEKLMWQYLRNRKFRGLRFVRQFSVGPYILDFYCPKMRLAIELDGESHDSVDARIYDEERSDYLDGAEIQIIRFKNRAVVENISNVLDQILREGELRNKK